MTDTLSLPKPILGINNVAEETDIPKGALREAINVNINRVGDVLSRDGSQKVYTGTNIHSYFERYFVEEGTFKYLNNDYTANTKFSGLDKNKELSYCRVNTELVFTNGDNNFKEDGSFFGIESPPGQPILSITSGQLLAGIYQIAICFINPNTFELSGTTTATSITVTDNSGINLINIPQSNEGYDCAVYITNLNGETLYHQTTIANGITSYIISVLNKQGKTLDTQHLTRMPAGQIIRVHKDRVYIANNSTLWFSESMRFGLCRAAKNFFNFPKRIKIVEPVEDGLYIVADKTYFLSGIDVNKMSIRTVSPDTAVEGTGLSVKSSHFGIESSYNIAYWFSDKGAILGMLNGQIKNLTEGRLSVDVGDKGISDYRELAGIRQVVSRLNKKSSQGNFGASDYATGEILRNGVLIN